MIKIKHGILLFFSGILLGIGLSPLSSTKPQDIHSQPVPVYAAPVQIQALDPMPANSKYIFDISAYLNFFNYEQKKLARPTPNPQLLSSSTQLLKPTINPVSKDQKSLTIALLGDSMIDTMGTNCPYLAQDLKKYYPNYQFNFLNYGIGAQPVGQAFKRLNSEYQYKDRSYSAILSSTPDIIILGSFAYNPYENLDSGLDQYQAELNTLISELKKTQTQLIFLATIAPLKTKFGQGPGGVNWPADTAYTHATKIQSYLEAGIKVAQDHNLPIINLYQKTIKANGEGIASYVSTHDGIHPSVAGHQYIASQISAYLVKNKLL